MLNFKQFSSLFFFFDWFLRLIKELKNREFSRLSLKKESGFAPWTRTPTPRAQLHPRNCLCFVAIWAISCILGSKCLSLTQSTSSIKTSNGSVLLSSQT